MLGSLAEKEGRLSSHCSSALSPALLPLPLLTTTAARPCAALPPPCAPPAPHHSRHTGCVLHLPTSTPSLHTPPLLPGSCAPPPPHTHLNRRLGRVLHYRQLVDSAQPHLQRLQLSGGDLQGGSRGEHYGLLGAGYCAPGPWVPSTPLPPLPPSLPPCCVPGRPCSAGCGPRRQSAPPLRSQCPRPCPRRGAGSHDRRQPLSPHRPAAPCKYGIVWRCQVT